MYEIQCYNEKELAQICATLVKEGVCFTADTTTYKITLTGGY